MKKTATILFMSLFIYTNFTAQSITGKLVDETGTGLSDIQLILYIGNNDFFTTSAADGSFVFNDVTNVDDNQLPTGYAVSDNFPNPFNPTTRLNITMPKGGVVKVGIFNILGQSVANTIEKNFEAGTNNIDLELNGLSNGIYIARITIDNQYTVVKKLMLLYGSQHLKTNGSLFNTPLNKSNNFFNTNSEVNLDSLVASSPIIGSKTFTELPGYDGNNLDLGNLVVERNCTGLPTIAYEGKTYNTVQIGSQCWLKENLNVGIRINGANDQQNGNGIEKYCYNDVEANCETYGGLYQWNEAMEYSTTPGTQGICPDGWHIPTIDEYNALGMTVYGSSNELKAFGQGTGDGTGTNTSGFSALLAGNRNNSGNFNDLLHQTDFWTSSNSESSAIRYRFVSDKSSIYYANDSKKYGFSVRCIKDVILNSCPDIPTVEYEGRIYNTVQIDDQCWLKENLNVGTRINGSENQQNGNGIEKYCYNDDEANCETYGGLYQWNEAMQYSTTLGAQGICPSGWHMPTLDEFLILANGPTVNTDGNRLKAIGQGTGDGAGTNTSGFSALLAGERDDDTGNFQYLHEEISLWTSTDAEIGAMRISLSGDKVFFYYMNKLEANGFGIRCLKN